MPAVLTVLGGQTRHPDAVVGVDVGSTDASSSILTDSLGHDRVVMLDRADDTGFGAAVAAGLGSGVLRSDVDEAFDVDTTEWIWLLHDDSAPAADCLEQLLLAAQANPSAVVLGPKSRGWHDRRLLLEMGFSITGSGRRVTSLERREHDQGQHDDRDIVHAVGSAGMLVRRDVWDKLGGFDPALPLYRDDLDFCWRVWRAGHEVQVVPEAVIHHREASYHGRREGSSAPGRGHRLDRRSALHALLVQSPGWQLPFTAIRLAIGTLLRSLLYLLGKDLRRAGDELAALGVILAHPGRLVAARRNNARTATMSSRAAVHDLRPRASTQVRAAVEALGGIMASGRGSGAGSGALESGPVSDDADLFDDPAGNWLRRTLARPTVGLTLALILATLVAGRSLWWGEGTLFGGALLPSPEGSGDLWSAYLRPWHDVGPGSFEPAAPAIAVLAAISTVLLGKAALTVGLALLTSSALAGLSAWASLRGVVESRPVRLWAAATYALLPVLTAGIATGRLGVLLALIVLPPAARFVARALDVAPDLPAPSGRTAWVAALLLAVAIAGAPLVWLWIVLATLAALIAAGVRRRLTISLALRAVVLIIAPLALLVPWSFRLLANPTLLLGDVGALDPALVDPAASPVSLALLDPGGPGTSLTFVGAGLVIAALLAVLRPQRRAAIVTTWGVALAAYALALVLSAVSVTVPSAPDPVRLWPGMAVALFGGALIVVVAMAGDGLRASMAGSTFSWRQPVALVATAAAVLVPVVYAVVWLTGASGPVHRADPGLLPPFVAAEAVGPEAPRTLLLDPMADEVGYTLLNGTGPTLGDGAVAPPAADWTRLDRLVSGLVSGRGGDEVIGLADYAIRYVIVQTEGPRAESVTRTLDSAPGLRRVAGQDGEVLWRVVLGTSRVAIDNGEGQLPVAVVDRGGDPLARRLLTDESGTVRLAQSADPRWRATLVDTELIGDSVDGLQTFALPAQASGALVVAADSSERTRWMWIQLVLLIVIVVLALPGRRHHSDDDVADDEVDEDDVAVLEKDGVHVQVLPPAPSPDDDTPDDDTPDDDTPDDESPVGTDSTEQRGEGSP